MIYRALPPFNTDEHTWICQRSLIPAHTRSNRENIGLSDRFLPSTTWISGLCRLLNCKCSKSFISNKRLIFYLENFSATFSVSSKEFIFITHLLFHWFFMTVKKLKTFTDFVPFGIIIQFYTIVRSIPICISFKQKIIKNVRRH